MAMIQPLESHMTTQTTCMVVVGGKVCTTSTDLQCCSFEELWKTLEQFVILNQYLQLHQVQQSSKQFNEMNEKNEEIAFLKHQIIEKDALLKEIDKYRQENEILTKKFAKVTKDLATVTDRLDALENKLSFRQIGMDTDRHILNYIFPKCSGKPFRLQTLTNLFTFLEHPESTPSGNGDICDEKAPFAWMAFTQEVKDDILKRRDEIKTACSGITISIKALKKSEFAHPKCDNYDAIMEYNRVNNPEIYEALEECRPFWDNTYFIK